MRPKGLILFAVTLSGAGGCAHQRVASTPVYAPYGVAGTAPGQPSSPNPVVEVDDSEIRAPLAGAEKPKSYYEYHPNSPLALGATFNPSDLTQTFGSPFDATVEVADSGSITTRFEYSLASTSEELKRAMHFDLSIDASFLFVSASAKVDSTVESAVSNDSLSIVLNAYSELSRRSLKVKGLTKEASDLLAHGQNAEFKRRYGTRYVTMERRGANLSVVIQVAGVASGMRDELKAAFKAEGWGVKVQAHVENSLSQQIQSQQVHVHAFGSGGQSFGRLGAALVGVAAFKEVLSDPANPSSPKLRRLDLDGVKAALANAMQDFAPEMGAPTGYFTSSLEDFGVRSTPASWGPDQEILLIDLAREYKALARRLEFINNLEQGVDPRGLLLSAAQKNSLFYDEKSTSASVMQQLSLVREGYKDLKRGVAPATIRTKTLLTQTPTQVARLVASREVDAAAVPVREASYVQGGAPLLGALPSGVAGIRAAVDDSELAVEDGTTSIRALCVAQSSLAEPISSAADKVFAFDQAASDLILDARRTWSENEAYAWAVLQGRFGETIQKPTIVLCALRDNGGFATRIRVSYRDDSRPDATGGYEWRLSRFSAAPRYIVVLRVDVSKGDRLSASELAQRLLEVPGTVVVIFGVASLAGVASPQSTSELFSVETPIFETTAIAVEAIHDRGQSPEPAQLRATPVVITASGK